MLVMRVLVLLVLTVLFFGPSTLPPTSARPRRPRLTVMLDTSASMQTEDEGGRSRHDFAVRTWLDASRLNLLRERCEVDLLAFDETVRSLGPTALARRAKDVATGNVSNIVQSLRDALGSLEGGDTGTSVLLLTDGHDTADEPFQSAAMLALGKSIPVHTVALGGSSFVRDVAVIALPMQDYLLAGEEGVIVVKVVQTGCGSLSARVQLSSGGSGDSEGSVETRTIPFEGRSSVQIEFPVKEERRGIYEYTVRVEPVAGELETRNNEQSTFLEVTEENLRVLIVEGQPFWDTKFIAQSLRKDERIELAQLTQVTTAKQQRIVTRAEEPHLAVPWSLEDLTRYDVIILGTGIEKVLRPHVIRQLPEFVGSHGGRLVFARGRAYDPRTQAGREAAQALSVLEPVVWGQGVLRDQRIALEPAGRTHPVFALTDGPGGPTGIAEAVGQLPAWTVLPKVSREKVLTKVLARVDPGRVGHLTRTRGQPAIAVMEYERGLVVSVLGEGLWRWRLLPRDKKHLAGTFDRFWSNLVRWLAMGSDYRPGEELSLHLSRKSVQVGDRVRLDAVCRFAPGTEFDATLTIIDPEGRQHSLAPHEGAGSTVLRQAEFTPDIPGIHTVRLEAPSVTPEPVYAKFNAYDLDTERIHCSARPQPLRFLSDASGGRFLRKESPDALLEVLRQQEAAMRVPPRLRYIWDDGWILVLLLVWSGLEWLIRKKGGLL